MILKSGREYDLPESTFNILAHAYPSIDIQGEIRKMEAWLVCNPAQRKTERGIGRFINSWLSRARPNPATNSTRNRTLEQDLNDRSWAL